MTINPNGIVQQPGQGISYWFARDLCTFKAVDKDTEQAYALCEIVNVNFPRLKD